METEIGAGAIDRETALEMADGYIASVLPSQTLAGFMLARARPIMPVAML